MKIINADTVVHWQSYDDETESYPEHTGTIAEFLDSMTDEGCPERVDAVPVVRCRDCKHYEWTANRVPEEQTWWCYKHNTEMGNNDFCSYGKRKGDNDNG